MRILLFSVAMIFASPPSSAEIPVMNASFSGIVTKVRDGDTFILNQTPIRLWGIHVPELDQPGGQAAKRFINQAFHGKLVSCRLTGDRSYDRLVGRCLHRGIDIAISLLSHGLALDCRRYSGGYYLRFESVSARSRIELPRYCGGVLQ